MAFRNSSCARTSSGLEDGLARGSVWYGCGDGELAGGVGVGDSLRTVGGVSLLRSANCWERLSEDRGIAGPLRHDRQRDSEATYLFLESCR
jgi:hypothetical protein